MNWRTVDQSRIKDRNPFFTNAVGAGVFERQAMALRIISESTSVANELRLNADSKLEHYRTAKPPTWLEAILVEQTALLRLHSALEYATVTFRSPHFDANFLRLVLRQLGRSLHSDTDTIALLLPIARGVQLPALSHARLANEAIKEIGARLTVSFPARTTAINPRQNTLDILMHEPVTTISALGGGANQTRLVTFQNGMRGVFKPMFGEVGYLHEARSTDWILFNREVSAFDIVMNWLGGGGTLAAFIPATVEVTLVHDGQSLGVGSLQLFKEGFVPLKALREKNSEAWARLSRLTSWKQTEAWIRTVDYLLGNYDRFPNSKHQAGNYDNLLVRYDGVATFEVALIDNGIGRKSNSFIGEFGIEDCPIAAHIPAELKTALFAFDGEAFRHAYHDRLPTNGIADLLGRLEAIRQRLLTTQ